jgi:hypothetical protein
MAQRHARTARQTARWLAGKDGQTVLKAAQQEVKQEAGSA